MGKVKKLDMLAETKFLKLYDATYEDKLGNEGHWTLSSRKSKECLEGQYFEGKKEEPDAVVIVPYHKDEEKLVLIKQFRVPLNDYIYELPAGLIDNNEEVEFAAKRELKEETGLKLEGILENKTGEKLYLSPGMTDESVTLVYCICSGTISKEYLEKEEDIETILVSPKEAEKLLNSDKKFDIKCYIILQKFIHMKEKIFN